MIRNTEPAAFAQRTRARPMLARCEAIVAIAAQSLALGTTCDRADRPCARCCFALAEESSKKTGPARLVVVRSGVRPELEVLIE
jgi:hypothetical protein